MNSATSIGIYFDNDRVDLTAVTRTFRGITIKGALSLSMPEVPGDRESTLQRIKDFVRDNGGKKSDLYAALSRREVTLTCLELPLPTEENLAGVLGYELDRYSPYSREEAYFDFRIIGRDAERGTISVVLAIIPKEKFEEPLELLGSLEVTPKSVELSSTALANGLLYARELSPGRELLLNIDGGFCELIMLEDDQFYYSRSFELGDAFEVEGLSLEIKRALKARGWSVESLSGVLLGGDFGFEGGSVAEKLGAEIGVEISPIDPIPETSDEGTAGPRPKSHRVSFGLALRGLEECVPPLDFMPPDENVKSGKVFYSRAVQLVAAVAVVALAVLLIPLLSGYIKLKRLENEMALLSPDVRRVEVLMGETMEIKSGLKQLGAAGSGEGTLLDLLKELTTVMPEDAWLTNFVYKNGKVEISGYAASASSLIPKIESSSFFTGVEFAAPVTRVSRQTAVNSMGGSGSRTFLRGRQAATGPQSGESLDRFKIKALREVRS